MQLHEPPLPGLHRRQRPLLPRHGVPLPRLLLRKRRQRQGEHIKTIEPTIIDIKLVIGFQVYIG